MEGNPGRTAGASRADRDELAAIVRFAEDAIFAKTLDGTITTWNAAAEALYGWRADEIVGRNVAVLVPDDRKDELRLIFERLRRGEQIATFQTQRVAKDGAVVDVSLTISPVKSAAGEVIGASAIARDVTHAIQSTERTARLLEVTTALAGALTVETVVRATIELATRALDADGGVLVLRSPTPGMVRLVAAIGYGPDFLATWDEWPLDSPIPINDAIRSGRLLTFESVRAYTDLYTHQGPLLTADTKSLVAVPLATDGPPVGALGLRFRDTRVFGAADRDFIRSLGGQCAIALERARLYEAERTGRDRLAVLAEAGERLAASLDIEETVTTLTSLAVPRMADWCGVALRRDDGSIERRAIHHADPAKDARARHVWATLPFDPEGRRGMPQVLRTGKPELLAHLTPEEVAELLPPEERAAVEELGLESAMVVPLQARGRVMGAVAFVSATPGRRYGPSDMTLAEELARRAAMALDNARLFSERAQVARSLQTSLLPRVLPTIPGVERGACYVAAGAGSEVGGDFYDVFAAGPNLWAVVIGDVCGKGSDAAGVTALARYTIRALASHRARAADLLADLNDAIVTQAGEGADPSERFLTVAFALAEPCSSPPGALRLTLALAGHPRPLVLRGDGTVESVGTPGPLLGVFPTVDVTETVVELAPGEVVAFYTDGVTEARGDDGFFGEERLAAVLTMQAEAGDTDPDTIADAVAVAVGAHRGAAERTDADDMAVLVLRCAT